MEIVKQKKTNYFIKKVEINQNYNIGEAKDPAYNEKLTDNNYKIEIFLSRLLSRKNMAFKRLVKHINEYFLLEYLCVILQEQGLWSINLCANSPVCSIKKTISFVNNFLN